MGTTLTGTTPANTYDSLIKVTDNGPLSGTAKYLSDGLGNDSVLALSTGNIGIGLTNPNAYNVGANDLVIGGGAFKGMTIAATTEGNINFADGTSGADLYRGAIGYNHTSDALYFYSASAERMRITSDGLVGIGTSSPSSFSVLSLAKNGVSEYASVSCSNSSSTATLFVGVGGSAVGATALRNNAYVMNVAASDLILGTGDFERMRITSTGNVGIGTTSPANIGAGYAHLAISGATTGVLSIQSGTNRIFSLASIGDDGLLENRTATGSLKFRLATGTTEICAVTPNGLTFNGDTAAANALDDYEEGTWTPVLSNGSTEVAISHTYATYTKIGRQVTVNARTVNGDLSSFSLGDNISFTGIPFAAGGDYYSMVYVRGATAGNLVRLIQSSNGSSRLSTDLLVSELVDDTTDYWFTITYFV